jgi:hypothetical protein
VSARTRFSHSVNESNLSLLTRNTVHPSVKYTDFTYYYYFLPNTGVPFIMELQRGYSLPSCPKLGATHGRRNVRITLSRRASGLNSTLRTRTLFVVPAKAGIQGGPAQCPQPWTPAFAGATRGEKREPSVWFAPLEVPRLRRYARALTRGRDRADDLVQETLLRALSKAHLWQAGTDIRAWLFTIMHNQHVNAVRRAIREEDGRHRGDVIFACRHDRPYGLTAAAGARARSAASPTNSGR